ncbi:putative transmembrane protein [Rhodopirellula islandica]|uniref:Transmembrane protein n=1 Tax=Rhodopirellula islandica TaxID=595434 RepID=A0A0J1BG75_RHOIS|nr:FecR domain-containing protein [Rhodopirellula islandica]KLU05531.1 putative transmembrane protein [Rhodopirellula islandica]
MDPSQLIQQYLLGTLSDSQVADLEQQLASDLNLRKEFAIAAATDAGLRDLAIQRSMEPPVVRSSTTNRNIWLVGWCAMAASLLLAFLFTTGSQTPTPIATLSTSENAAWESSLPTTVGSKLVAGNMKLMAGIATVEFESGAKITFEAPAHFELLDAMRVRMVDGAAVIDVPESAHGFVVETPGGFAIDHGTQFAVSVQESSQTSDFEVLQGEISVHHPTSGKEVHLFDKQFASLSDNALSMQSATSPEQEYDQSNADRPRVIRVGTEGRSDYVIRNNRRGKWIHPEMLMVKRADSRKWDMRAMFSMSIDSVDLNSVSTARLRLNQVPSGKGFASRLPKLNTFAIYGVTHRSKETWDDDPSWEDAPDITDGILLGKFDIPRSQQTGTFGIQSDALLQFLRNDNDGRVTFVLVRESGLVEGTDRGLVHAFANDAHPEVSGPLLEFTLD